YNGDRQGPLNFCYLKISCPKLVRKSVDMDSCIIYVSITYMRIIHILYVSHDLHANYTYIIQESHAIAYIIRIFTCIIRISKKHVFLMEESNQQDQKMLTDDDILEKLQKNKEALPRVEQAYFIAHERFLNAKIGNVNT